MIRLVIAARAIPCCEKLIFCTSVMGTEDALGVLVHPGIASVTPSSEAMAAGSMLSASEPTSGTTTDQSQFWNSLPAQDVFLAGMADAASAVVDYFHGSMAFVNVMKNLSVDCDCCAVAEDPCMKDIGILSSLDPVALDQACIDLVKASNDPGRDHLLERINSRHGTHTIDAAAALGFGTQDYELISLD